MRAPVRVVQLCTDPGIAWGGGKGAAVHLGELARALAAAGAEVLSLVTRIDPAAPPPPPGVTVEALPGPGKAPVAERLAGQPVLERWLTARLRAWGADVVYERIALHSASGVAAARAAGAVHLVEVNAPLPAEAARYRRLDQPDEAHRLEATVLASTDVVLAVSRPLGHYATRRGATRVEVLPNAVDPARFPVPADAAAGGDRPVAVFSGSLRPWHGTGVLAEAWDRLGADAPELLIVGDGDGRDELAAVGARITGMVPHDAVPGRLAGAQIGLAPYPADAPDYFSPLKLYEYLAAGLAVVAAALPGVVDVAGDAVVLVPPGDPDALAAAVAGLAADPFRRAQLGAAGRARVLDQHTWRHRAERVLDLAATAHGTTDERGVA